MEVRELDVVPVNGHLVDVAIVTALLEETGNPIEAVGRRGGAGASEGVTAVGERPDVTVPSGNSVRDGGVSLAGFVDPVGRSSSAGK